MNAADLLPCPFCGAQPTVERSEYAGDDDYGEAYAYCPGINCPGSGGGTIDAWETRVSGLEGRAEVAQTAVGNDDHSPTRDADSGSSTVGSTASRRHPAP